MYAIETEALTKRFRQLQSYRDLARYPWRRSTQGAVEDVALQIREGELFGLLGENRARPWYAAMMSSGSHRPFGA